MPRTHLRLTAPVAPRALLPEDPAAALALAQELLGEPRMSNHTLGLWGYYGLDSEGEELTIQATGLTGSGSAIVLGELAAHGVRSAIRVGTCGARAAEPAPGTKLVVTEVVALDGASRQLGAPGALAPDPALTAGLLDRGLEGVCAATLDLPAKPGEDDGGDATVTDLASAPLVAAGSETGVAIASALVVAEAPGAEPLGDQVLAEEGLELGRSALAALRSAETSPAS